MPEKLTLRFLFLSFAVMLLDLTIKYIVISNFEPTEVSAFMNGLFSIGRIETRRIELGYPLLRHTGFLFQLIMVLFFIRMWKAPVALLFKIAGMFIVFGWAGIYFDRLIFAKGQHGYLQTDYFYIPSVVNFFFSLNGLMIMSGWILLVIATITKFSDVKIIFSRQKLTRMK